MGNSINPIEAAGIYVERQDSGAYSLEVVTLGGASVTVELPRLNGELLKFAYESCMTEVARHYGKLAIPGNARTPGKIIVPR